MAFLYIGWWGGTVYIVSLGVCASRDNAGLVRPLDSTLWLYVRDTVFAFVWVRPLHPAAAPHTAAATLRQAAGPRVPAAGTGPTPAHSEEASAPDKPASERPRRRHRPPDRAPQDPSEG